jgi:chromosome segregation ATPase
MGKIKKNVESELKQRTIEEIQKEYDSICGEAGDKQYQIRALESRLMALNLRLSQLHQEFTNARATETPKK